VHENNSKEAKLLKTMKFPPCFATPVDLARVNWEVVRPWIADRVTALLGGVEDDVLIGFISEQLEGKEVREGRVEREGEPMGGATVAPGRERARAPFPPPTTLTPACLPLCFFHPPPPRRPSTRACCRST